MKRVISAAVAAVLATTAPAMSGDIDTKEFAVVGTWGNLFNWKEHESRLWGKILPEASDGKLTANAKPYTELGLSGYEVVKLLKLGTYDAVHALTTYTSQDSPALEGIDLAGVFQDFATYRKALQAYEPVIRRELRDKYNAELVMLYTFPSQQLFCNLGDGEDGHLASLEGKKIRTYSTSLADFIEGLGASSVTIAFAEAVPALQKGVADCGTTGTAPAYNAKWYQVTTHNVRVRLGYAATFMAFNGDAWDALSADTQALIKENAAKVENEIWDSIQATDSMALQCNSSGPCDWGETGNLQPIEMNDADNAKIKDIVQNVVLKRFAERCGKACAEEWNATMGDIAGVQAPL
ncbi:MAG: TRAP transporter substrate-binding protein [Paracoccaceae bacterium]|nr:TRAP transporter substrate-binding protein [Paracoccaceae bacterium]